MLTVYVISGIFRLPWILAPHHTNAHSVGVMYRFKTVWFLAFQRLYNVWSLAHTSPSPEFTLIYFVVCCEADSRSQNTRTIHTCKMAATYENPSH